MITRPLMFNSLNGFHEDELTLLPFPITHLSRFYRIFKLLAQLDMTRDVQEIVKVVQGPITKAMAKKVKKEHSTTRKIGYNNTFIKM